MARIDPRIATEVLKYFLSVQVWNGIPVRICQNIPNLRRQGTCDVLGLSGSACAHDWSFPGRCKSSVEWDSSQSTSKIQKLTPIPSQHQRMQLSKCTMGDLLTLLFTLETLNLLVLSKEHDSWHSITCAKSKWPLFLVTCSWDQTITY